MTQHRPDNMKVAPRAAVPAWLKAVLIASLAANVAIIGIVAGNRMKDSDAPRAGNRQVEWILKMVPSDRRDFTKEHFAQDRQALRASFLSRNAQMDRIVDAIRAEPYVSEDLAKVLEERRNTTIERRVLVHTRLISLMEAFEPDERKLFADNLSERLEDWRSNRASLLKDASAD